jgi:preprotein translocase subunit SecD
MTSRTATRKAGLLVSWALAAGIAAGGDQPNEHRAGFYLIAAEAPSADALPAPSGEQQIARYDQKFLRESEREAPTYLLLPRRPDVALKLVTPPAITKGPNGFAELRLELTKEAAADLERVSREHLGQTVSLMIDGEVVTKHKVRSVITGGQFRLSRCTDDACQYILGRLTAER